MAVQSQWHRAKGDRFVCASMLPVYDNEYYHIIYKLTYSDWPICISDAAVVWFSGSGVTKHTPRGNSAWLSGSDVERKVISHVNDFNVPE